jgi:hypothetical protein
VQATRKQDRRLAAALLAAALAHTPEAEEVLRGARTRMARKPSALARELLRNFPKGRRRRSGRKRRGKGGGGDQTAERGPQTAGEDAVDADAPDVDDGDGESGEDEAKEQQPKRRSRRRRRKSVVNADPGDAAPVEAEASDAADDADEPAAA